MNGSRQFGAKLVPFVLGCSAVTYALLAIAVGRRSPDTSYVGHSVRLAWSFAIAGVALIGAGAVTVWRRPQIGVLSWLAGLMWFAPLWEGWSDGPSLVRSVGMLSTALVFPVLIHLTLTASGQPMSAAGRTLVVATYSLVGGSAVVLALVRDPFLDPYCWANCTTNVFAIAPNHEVAQRVLATQRALMATSAAAFTVMCVAQLFKAFRGPRRYWEVLPGGAVLGIATVAYRLQLRRVPLEEPGRGGFDAVFLVRCAAVTLIAAGLGAALLRAKWQRRSLARIVSALGEAPPAGTLDAALATAVGDPTLRIDYWMPDVGRFVAADGRDVDDPLRDQSASITPLVHDGQTIAVVAHHVDPVALERSLGPAARLALENERLQAGVRARMLDVTASRSRIVEAADARRCELERNLHDGAQQSILGLSYDIQVARASAAASGDDALVAVLDSALQDVRAAFAELRDLAHGIYPAVLTTAGLQAAVRSLADTYRESARNELDIDVVCGRDERYPSAIEAAAYVVVASGLDAARRSGTDHVAVAIGRRNGLVEVEVRQDDKWTFPALVDVADRVSAAGGRVLVDGSRLLAEIPCGS